MLRVRWPCSRTIQQKHLYIGQLTRAHTNSQFLDRSQLQLSLVQSPHKAQQHACLGLIHKCMLRAACEPCLCTHGRYTPPSPFRAPSSSLLTPYPFPQLSRIAGLSPVQLPQPKACVDCTAEGCCRCCEGEGEACRVPGRSRCSRHQRVRSCASRIHPRHMGLVNVWRGASSCATAMHPSSALRTIATLVCQKKFQSQIEFADQELGRHFAWPCTAGHNVNHTKAVWLFVHDQELSDCIPFALQLCAHGCARPRAE